MQRVVQVNADNAGRAPRLAASPGKCHTTQGKSGAHTLSHALGEIVPRQLVLHAADRVCSVYVRRSALVAFEWFEWWVSRLPFMLRAMVHAAELEMQGSCGQSG